MAEQDKTAYLNTYTDILKEILMRIFQKYGKFLITQETEIKKHDIMEYNRRMRVSAMEKFNAPGYLSSVSFYRTQKDLDTHHACGALVIHIVEENLKKIFEALGITGFDDDDPEHVIKKNGELCTLVAEEFKKELTAKGYPELVISKPVGARNAIADGVDFGFDQYEKIDMTFSFKNNKILNVEITLTNLPHR